MDGIAARGHDDAARRVGRPADLGPQDVLVDRGFQQVDEIALEAHHLGLGLRVAEAAVELEDARSRLGDHQPGVEDALELPPLFEQTGDGRQDHGGHDLVEELFGHQRRRGDGAHAARVRPLIAVVSGLVVHGRDQGLDPQAVGDDDERHLAAAEELLDDDAPAGRPELLLDEHLRGRLLGLLRGGADDDALAGREAVGLDHDGIAEFARGQDFAGIVIVVDDLEPAGRDAVPAHELLGEDLAAFDLGRLLRGAEDAETAPLELVDDAHGQGHLGTDDGQADLLPLGEMGQPGEVRLGQGDVLGDEPRPAVAGRAVDRLDPGALGDLPGQGMLPAA